MQTHNAEHFKSLWTTKKKEKKKYHSVHREVVALELGSASLSHQTHQTIFNPRRVSVASLSCYDNRAVSNFHRVLSNLWSLLLETTSHLWTLPRVSEIPNSLTINYIDYVGIFEKVEKVCHVITLNVPWTCEEWYKLIWCQVHHLPRDSSLDNLKTESGIELKSVYHALCSYLQIFHLILTSPSEIFHYCCLK